MGNLFSTVKQKASNAVTAVMGKKSENTSENSSKLAGSSNSSNNKKNNKSKFPNNKIQTPGNTPIKVAEPVEKEVVEVVENVVKGAPAAVVTDAIIGGSRRRSSKKSKKTKKSKKSKKTKRNRRN